MTDSHLDRRRFLLLAGGALLAACGGPATSDPGAAPSSTPDDGGTPSSTPSPTPSPSTTAAEQLTAEPAEIAARSPNTDFPEGIVPTRIEIPTIGVDAQVEKVNLTAEEVEVPDFGLAGWWVQTREPGEIGPAVIGGHVDTKSGPDVFFRLKELRPGDEIVVSDDAGETRRFTVDDEPLQVDKQERPPEVFGFTEAKPQLRLITCGGEFNPAVGHYTDNIVVFSSDPDYTA